MRIQSLICPHSGVIFEGRGPDVLEWPVGPQLPPPPITILIHPNIFIQNVKRKEGGVKSRQAHRDKRQVARAQGGVYELRACLQSWCILQLHHGVPPAY